MTHAFLFKLTPGAATKRVNLRQARTSQGISSALAGMTAHYTHDTLVEQDVFRNSLQLISHSQAARLPH